MDQPPAKPFGIALASRFVIGGRSRPQAVRLAHCSDDARWSAAAAVCAARIARMVPPVITGYGSLSGRWHACTERTAF